MSSWTIERDYIDAFGHSHAVAAEDFDCVAACLGRDRAHGEGSSVIVSRRRDGAVPLSMDSAMPRNAVVWELHDREGATVTLPANQATLAVPPELKVGSYTLLARDAVGHAAGFPLLIAPARAFQPDFVHAGQRLWVWSVQLYAVRSRRNWGIGDFTDLQRLLDLAAQTGAAGVGINPLHALSTGQASPYSPTSRRFLSPLYIDLEAVPEFTAMPAGGFADKIAGLRATDVVDYAAVEAIKIAALRQCHRVFRAKQDSARHGMFERFRRDRGEALACFAAFEVLKRRYPSPWWQWPEPWRRPTAAALCDLRTSSGEELEFYEFVQWLADDQLRACRDRARTLKLPVGLYLDLAVGIDPNGADMWSSQPDFAQGLSVGAPPDAWNPAGQNWGIASFHPQTLIDSDFEILRQTLRAVMRYAGAVRIDHALGLNRMFLIPQGTDATHGAYVRFPFAAMLAVVAQESVAHRCLVIGEDLGTVPEGVSEALRDWGVWSYRVALFERHHDGTFRRPNDYPADAIVTFSTHDLPTFAGWASGHDLAVKQALGIDVGGGGHDRDLARQRLREALAREGIGLGSPAWFVDVARFLARTPCRLLAVALEDALAIADQANVPGTVAEHPNWVRRLPVDLEEIVAHETVHDLAGALAVEGRAPIS